MVPWFPEVVHPNPQARRSSRADYGSRSLIESAKRSLSCQQSMLNDDAFVLGKMHHCWV